MSTGLRFLYNTHRKYHAYDKFRRQNDDENSKGKFPFNRNSLDNLIFHFFSQPDVMKKHELKLKTIF